MTLTDLAHAALFVKGLDPPPYKIGELAYIFDITKLTNLVHSLLPSNHRLLELVADPSDGKDTETELKTNARVGAKVDNKINTNSRKQYAGKSLGAPIRMTDKGGLTVHESVRRPSSRSLSSFRGRLRGELVHEMTAMGQELCVHLTYARSASNDIEYEIFHIQEPVFGPIGEGLHKLREQHDAIRLPEISAEAATEEQIGRRKWEIMQQDKVLEKKQWSLEEPFRSDLIPINGCVTRMRTKFLSNQRQERKKIYDRYQEAINASKSWDDSGYDAWRDEAKHVALTLLKMVDRSADLHLDVRGLAPGYEHPVPRVKD
ncbi:MAG: hypothetical protein M1831_005488 [Alyxoria varia]|nr:MAG: hypothetical protein M1831_005488 [Alyxoria varia]